MLKNSNMPIFYLFFTFICFFLSDIHPSLKNFKTLSEPGNIFNDSDEKKLFISWNTKYQQLTFLTNHTSSNMVLNHTLLNEYSLENNILNKFLKDDFFNSISSAYVIPWQFKNYKKECESKAIMIKEGDTSTDLSSASIYIPKKIKALDTAKSKITFSSFTDEFNYNEQYQDNSCRYFFTENYLFVAYTCKDYFITNTLDVGAFELDTTVLTDMKNYFKKEKKEEKNINYHIFVYKWNPEQNFEFKIDDNEFIIKYNSDNNTITIANKKRQTTEYLLTSKKSEIFNVKFQISNSKNSNTDIKIIDSIFYDNQTEDWTCVNQSHVSIFSFNQKEPIYMEKGYFLDFKEKNFFPEAAFNPENMQKIKLYLFPFDSHNQTTVYTNNSTIEFTLINENLLKIKHIENKIEKTFEKNTFFNTSNGYFGWTKTCITLCDINNLDTIKHANGYVLDQTKYPFLNTIKLNDEAFNSCNYIKCPQKDKPHFHEKFPSLLIIPFDKNGKASFVNHLNHEVQLELIDTNQSNTNQNVSHESVNQITNFQIPIDTFKKISPLITNAIIKDNNDPNRETNPKTESQGSQIEKNKTTPKSSFFSLFKIASFSLLTLFLITAIIKSHIFFTFK